MNPTFFTDMNSFVVQIKQECDVIDPLLGKSDVVLVGDGQFVYNNRWKLENELVDFSAVQCWKDRDLTKCLNWSLLKRIKIYGGLPRPNMTILLNYLSKFSQLKQLEIDVLNLLRASNSTYLFDALDLLSIDAVKMVDMDNVSTKVPNERATVQIRARELNTVYLGTNASRHVIVNSPEFVILSVDQIGCNLSHPVYHKLQAFMCNRVQEVNIELIGKIANGELLPNLYRLFLNLEMLLFTAYRPRPLFIQYFERLFNHLKVYGIRSNLEIYFNHCQFSISKQFADYRFKYDLVAVHRHAYLVNRLNVQLCPSVSSCEYVGILDAVDQPSDRPSNQSSKQPLDRPERTFGFQEVNRMYENIHRVILNNEKQRKKLDADVFLQFLSARRALIELVIRWPNFGEKFYNCLAELDSVKSTLVTLIVFENPTEFRKCLDYRFLKAFTSLRKFHTNLVTRRGLGDVIDAIRPGSNFRMQFWTPIESEPNRSVIINRINNLFDVTIEIFFKGKQLPPDRGNYGFDELLSMLNKKPLPHWLDNFHDVLPPCLAILEDSPERKV